MSYNGGRSDSLLGSTNGGSDYSMSVSPYDSQPDTSTLLGKAKANRLYILYGIIGLLTVIIIALSAALHGAQSGSHTVPPPVTHSSSSSTGVPAPPPPVSPSSSSAGPVPPPINPLSSSSSLTPGGVPALRDLVTLDKLMHHARQLQRIADENYGNRYINMRGFNATVAYIESVLRANASTFAVNKQYFTRAGFQVAGSPDLTVSAAGDTFTYAYGSLYNVYIYSRSLLAINAPLVSVPNGGCTAADWANAVPSQTQGGVALVVRAGCSVTTRERLANGTGVIGVIEYNNDPSAGLLALEANPSTLGWLSMRYEEGKTIELIIQAAGSNPATPVTVSVNVSASYPNTVITNVCADTPTGSDTSVIVIGSHSDGVIAGSGMNDNGSGTCGNLVWATAVHELLTTRGAAAFPNKLRFCWWGAEEQGLLGSRYYVEQAKNATRDGWRLADHQMNLNYDMSAHNHIAHLQQSFTQQLVTDAVVRSVLSDAVRYQQDGQPQLLVRRAERHQRLRVPQHPSRGGAGQRVAHYAVRQLLRGTRHALGRQGLQRPLRLRPVPRGRSARGRRECVHRSAEDAGGA